MADPTQNKTFAELYADVADYIFRDRAPTGANLATAKRTSNEGYLEFLDAHQWTFMTPQNEINLWPTTTTAAITITGSGLIFTVAAATFYPSMVGRTITSVTGENDYTINSYTSSTVVGVSSTAAADDGDTFTITANGIYGLPDDFQSFTEDPTYQTGGDSVGALRRTAAGRIRAMLSGTVAAQPPRYYGVQARTNVLATGQRWDMIVYPVPSALKTMDYSMAVRLAELTGDTDIPLGGPVHGRTIVAAAKMVAENDKGISSGPMWRHYYGGTDPKTGSIIRGRLQMSIDLDSQNRGHDIGYNQNRRGPVNVGRGRLYLESMT